MVYWRRAMPVDRPLGFSESFFHFMHAQGAYVIAVGARMRGPIREDLVQRALDRAQARHPLLRAHIVEERGALWFREAGTGPIPLRTLPRTSRASFERAMEDEIARPLPRGNAPRLRALLLTPAPGDDAFDLVLTMDHAVCDGASVVSIFDDLMADFDRLAKGGDPPPPEPLAAVPSVEALLAARGPIAKFTGKADKQDVPLVPKKAPPGERRTRLLFRDLDTAEVTRLAARCREEKTSVNGVLTAAALRAMQRESGGRAHLGVISNVALRDRGEPKVGNDQVGNFVSYVQTFHDVTGDTPLWELSRECKTRIDAAVAAKEPEGRLAPGQLVWWQRGFLRHAAPRIKHGMSNALAVSNSGRLALVTERGDFRMEAIYAASSQHVIGSSIALFVWSIAGALHVVLGCAAPIVSPDRAARIADDLAHTLRTLG